MAGWVWIDHYPVIEVVKTASAHFQDVLESEFRSPMGSG